MCTNEAADSLESECFGSMDNEGEYNGILECKRANGTSYWADTHVVVEYDEFNNKTGYLIFQQDVTQKVLKQNVHFTDTLARWGGEEFVVLLPQADITHAVTAAKKIRSAIEKHDFVCDERITASFGVSMTQSKDTQTAWLNRADRALYLAKESGKNSVNYL